MLMSLGLFTFSLQTAPFETVRRATSQRWAKADRIKKGAAQQWTGPGDDTLVIEGVLMPEATGGAENLDKLRDMAAQGKAWILTAGTGETLGRWIIEQVDERRSRMRADGSPRKIDFSLALRRYWDDDANGLGDLMDSRP